MGRRHWVRLFFVVCLETALVTWLTVSENPSDWDSLQRLSEAAMYFPIVFAIHAGYSAYEFGVFQRAGSMLRPARSGLRTLFGYWWPVLLVPTASFAITMCVLAGALPTTWVERSIIGMALLGGVASSIFGLGIARWLPIVFAVPAAAVTWYAWVGFPGGSTNKLLRNLNSDVSSCCVEGTRLSNSFFAGSGLLLLVIIVGTLAPFWGHRWINARMKSLALWSLGTVAAAFTIGAIAALALGPLDLNGLWYDPAIHGIEGSD